MGGLALRWGPPEAAAKWCSVAGTVRSTMDRQGTGTEVAAILRDPAQKAGRMLGMSCESAPQHVFRIGFFWVTAGHRAIRQ